MVTFFISFAVKKQTNTTFFLFFRRLNVSITSPSTHQTSFIPILSFVSHYLVHGKNRCDLFCTSRPSQHLSFYCHAPSLNSKYCQKSGNFPNSGYFQGEVIFGYFRVFRIFPDMRLRSWFSIGWF